MPRVRWIPHLLSRSPVHHPNLIRSVIRRANKDHLIVDHYGDRWILKGSLYEEKTWRVDCPHNGKTLHTERIQHVSKEAEAEYLEREQLRKLRRKGIVK